MSGDVSGRCPGDRCLRAFWNGDLREDGGEDAVFQPAFGTAVIQGRGGDDLVSGRLCDRKTSDRFHLDVLRAMGAEILDDGGC